MLFPYHYYLYAIWNINYKLYISQSKHFIEPRNVYTQRRLGVREVEVDVALGFQLGWEDAALERYLGLNCSVLFPMSCAYQPAVPVARTITIQ